MLKPVATLKNPLTMPVYINSSENAFNLPSSYIATFLSVVQIPVKVHKQQMNITIKKK